MGVPTLPIDEVYNLLRQSDQPPVRPGEYAAAREEAEVQHITSDFFREVAAQLRDFSSVRGAQIEAYRQRQARLAEQAEDSRAAQVITDQATQDNIDRVEKLQMQQFQLEQLAKSQSIDNPVDASLLADATVEGEDEEGGGFLSGLRDIAEGTFEIATGVSGSTLGPLTELIETPAEVGRELITGGGISGVRRELSEGVSGIREPLEAGIEIAREAIRGDLAQLKNEIAEAGREVPQTQELVQAWDGLNKVMLGEQKIFAPITRPIIEETLKAFQIPDGISGTIAKYAAEVLVPTTFIPIYGQVGKTKGAAQLLKVAMAEGSINMLQNRAGRVQRGEGDPNPIEDLTMFTFGAGGRLGLEAAARALSRFLGRGATKATGEAATSAIDGARSARELAPDEVRVYHGSGGKITGDTLEEGTFVTTDRAAAQRYADVDAKVREVQGKPTSPTVYESVVKREALGDVPPDATTLGEPYVLRQSASVQETIGEAAEKVTQKATVEEQAALRLEHYSPERREVISPEFAGQGGHARGAELEVGGPKVSHFYEAGTTPERTIRGVKHTVEVPEQDILDLASDEGQRLVDQARAAKKEASDVALNMGDIRQAAKDAGYKGVRNTTDELNRVQMFESTTPLPESSPTRFADAVQSTKANDGGTFDTVTGEAIPYEGYFVGGGVPTKTVPLDEFEKNGPQLIDNFITDNADAFSDSNLKVGTEVVEENGRKVVNIDATTPIADRENALSLAADRGEQRIWDANNNAAIEVPGVRQVQTSRQVVAETVSDEETKRLVSKLNGWSEPDKQSIRAFVGVRKSTIGSASHSWVNTAKTALAKVIEAIKRLGRKFHTSELGALRVGRKVAIEGAAYGELMNIGAARRWLHPEETWDQWASFMSRRIGGKKNYWLSTARKDVRDYIERNIGLLGEGPQGGGVRVGGEITERFGPPTHPRTYQELVDMVDEGSKLFNAPTHNTIDMRKWYDGFHRFMKDTFGEDADVVTMFAAATQANQSPTGGVPGALRAYVSWKLGEPITGQSSATIRKMMETIVRGGVPEGPKINPFWEALRFQGKRGRNAVAIDRWMMSAIGAQQGQWKNLAGNKRFIRFAQTLIQEAADEAGISPRSFQAAIWGATKRDWNRVREATGQKILGDDFSFFHDLFKRKMSEQGLRAPRDFRRLAEQAELFDVETLERQTAQALETAIPGETAFERSNRLNQLMYSEWNEKIAASTLLETGEIPDAIANQTARDRVAHIARMYQRQFADRAAGADLDTLKTMSKKGRLPQWQKDIVDEALSTVEGRGNAVAERMKTLPIAERERLKQLGWEHVPLGKDDLIRVQRELDELDSIMTVPALTRWLKKNEDFVGEWQQWIGRKLPTGRTYIDATGKTVEKHAMAPYWESRPFYETGRRLNIPRIKAAIRSRYPDQRVYDGTYQPIGDAMRVKKSDPLGACA